MRQTYTLSPAERTEQIAAEVEADILDIVDGYAGVRLMVDIDPEGTWVIWCESDGERSTDYEKHIEIRWHHSGCVVAEHLNAVTPESGWLEVAWDEDDGYLAPVNLRPAALALISDAGGRRRGKKGKPMKGCPGGVEKAATIEVAKPPNPEALEAVVPLEADLGVRVMAWMPPPSHWWQSSFWDADRVHRVSPPTDFLPLKKRVAGRPRGRRVIYEQAHLQMAMSI
ncbi:MAG TPA: hypothetical protein VNR89_17500 [Roseomonas sp.]|nr:hypothetical protein [Roseomonas sp.]